MNFKLKKQNTRKRRARTAMYKQRRKRGFDKKRKFSNQIFSSTSVGVVVAPIGISLYKPVQHLELVKFLSNFRKATTRYNRVRIDFSKTQGLTSCGGLLLLSEVYRAVKATTDTCKITCTYPESEKVEKVLQQIGLFNLLEKPCRKTITEEDKDIFHWKFATGIEVEPVQADPILKGIKSQIPRHYKKVVVGVEEAMDNSVHHAYISSRDDRLTGKPNADERRWWILAEILDDWLYVNFCDLGVGIPQSLPKKWEEEATDLLNLKITARQRDARMIERAFTVGRTRTDKGHRGKGLKNIASAAKELGGRLAVYSNAGAAMKNYRDQQVSEVTRTYKRSIMGTVIQWSIPLSGNKGPET